MWPMLAALAAGAAVWIGYGPGPAQARLLALAGGAGPPGEGDAAWRRRWARLVRPRPAEAARAWRRTVIELCQGLAAELMAGRTPAEALTHAAAPLRPPDPAVLRPVLAAARDGGDVAAALAAAGAVPGAEGLRRLAACWQVATTVGGGLAALVDRLAGCLREAEAHRDDVAAQLAGPRATARLLAGLPLLGLLLAEGAGMRPVAFLCGGPAGVACLAAGLALGSAGLWWMRRMAARVAAQA